MTNKAPTTDEGPVRGHELDGLTDAWEEFIVAVRRVRARMGDREEGLSLSQYEFLRPLMSFNGLPVSRLAERFGIAPASATQMLDSLERVGIIERERSERDRRTVTITLTAEGRRMFERKRRALAAQRRRFFEDLEPEERSSTERVLRHLAQLIGEL